MKKMIVTTAGKYAVAAVMLAAMIGAPAAEAASPRAHVTLSGGSLTLGDVFPDANANRAHVLAPAPAVGQDMVLGAGDLMRISNAFNLGWNPDASPVRQTVVSAQGVRIVGSEIMGAIESAVEAELGIDTVELGFDTPIDTVAFRTETTPQIEVSAVKLDRSRDVFSADVKFVDANGRAQGAFTAVGRFYATLEVPVLAHAVKAGDEIRAGDIDYVRIRTNAVAGRMIVNAEDLVGMSPRRTLPAGKVISATDLAMPRLVKKGQLVTMVLKTPVMSLTVQGKALSDGAQGEVIKVSNTSSQKIIDAVVSGHQEVTVQNATL